MTASIGAPVAERRLAVFLSFSGAGGVERMVMRLLPGLLEYGPRDLAVDLLAANADRVPASALPAEIRLIDLHTRHSTRAAGALARYLRHYRPHTLLAVKDRAIRTAVRARRRAGGGTRLVGRLGTNLSASLAGRGRAMRWWRLAPMRRLYARVDHIVAVSAGVAADTRALTGLSEQRVSVVRNPVVGPELAALAAEPLDHPWFREPVPVVLGAGRLTRQKDFATLVRAFARLRAARPARLVIVGDGACRDALRALSAELGVAADVELVGHVANPYAWMRRAALFVLSSAWEGSPNVLTEALACGTPVVATDCPSGPRELLADGYYGPLVPVGDDAAMAAAMARVLDAPPAPQWLLQAAADYTVAASARAYLRVLDL